MSGKFRLNVLRVVSVALISMGWMQFSVAGVIGTPYAVETETRAATLNNLDALLLEERVAACGVSGLGISCRGILHLSALGVSKRFC